MMAVQTLFKRIFPPRKTAEIPPDAQRYEAAKDRLLKELDTFGDMIRDMRSPRKKKPCAKGASRK